MNFFDGIYNSLASILVHNIIQGIIVPYINPYPKVLILAPKTKNIKFVNYSWIQMSKTPKQ